MAASGDSPGQSWSSNAASTAPAPHRSSTAGRKEPSGQRSPAAMTAIVESSGSCSRAIQSATATALRRLAPTTVVATEASSYAIDDPFGDGSTRRAIGPTARRLAGARLTWPGNASVRPTAMVAPCCSAYDEASVASQGYGNTTVPRSTATLSVVVNDSTSTMTATSAPVATALAPTGPHSNRTP